MKRKIKWIIVTLLAVFFATGIAFCLLRPSYVKEAAAILFQNELTVPNISRQNGIENPGQGPRERRKEQEEGKPGEQNRQPDQQPEKDKPEDSGEGETAGGSLKNKKTKTSTSKEDRQGADLLLF
jgi:hypothetical protein